MDVRLLDPDAFERLRSGDADLGSLDLSGLIVSHRSDVIRAFLLARFGGVWLDADCLVMRPLDAFIEWAMHGDFAGYREIQGVVSAGSWRHDREAPSCEPISHESSRSSPRAGRSVG